MLRSQLHSPTSPVHRFSWQRTLCFQSQHILPLPREVSLSPGEEPIQRHRARTQSGPRHSHAAAPRNRAHGPPNTAHRGICAWNACERAIRNVAIRVCWVVRRRPIRVHIWGSMKGRTYSSGRISLRTTGEIERTTISIACDCSRDAAHPTGGSLRGSHRGKPRPPCRFPRHPCLLWAVCDAFDTQCSPLRRPLASPPSFPSIWFHVHDGKGIGDPTERQAARCVFAHWITAVPITGTGTALPHVTNSWIRVSRRAAGKLMDLRRMHHGWVLCSTGHTIGKKEACSSPVQGVLSPTNFPRCVFVRGGKDGINPIACHFGFCSIRNTLF